MATLTALAPMLAVDDLRETIEFYATIGFACQGTFEVDGQPVWCSLERDGIRLMFTWDPPHTHDDGSEHTHQPGMEGSLYLYCEEIDALWEELRDKAPVQLEIGDRDYGMRDFAITDPNGYVLLFGGHLPAGGSST